MPQGPACRSSGISEGGKADLNRLIYSPAAAGSVGAKESNGQRSNIRLSFVLHSDFPSFRIQFRPGPLLDPDQILPRRGCPNELINLHLQRGAVPVLGILNQKNHQERDDAADGIHDKLPCIGKAEQWPTYQPDDDEAARQPNVHGRPVRRAVSEANLENQCSFVLRVKSPDPMRLNRGARR